MMHGAAQSQLLDRDHLLLSLGTPDASALRGSDTAQQASLIAVYCLSGARIVAVFSNSRCARDNIF